MKPFLEKVKGDPLGFIVSVAVGMLAVLAIVACICGVALATYCTWSFLLGSGVCT